MSIVACNAWHPLAMFLWLLIGNEALLLTPAVGLLSRLRLGLNVQGMSVSWAGPGQLSRIMVWQA